VFLDRLDAQDLVEDWTHRRRRKVSKPAQTCSRWR